MHKKAHTHARTHVHTHARTHTHLLLSKVRKILELVPTNAAVVHGAN
jgi:hypothetical protein